MLPFASGPAAPAGNQAKVIAAGVERASAPRPPRATSSLQPSLRPSATSRVRESISSVVAADIGVASPRIGSIMVKIQSPVNDHFEYPSGPLPNQAEEASPSGHAPPRRSSSQRRHAWAGRSDFGPSSSITNRVFNVKTYLETFIARQWRFISARFRWAEKKIGMRVRFLSVTFLYLRRTEPSWRQEPC